MNHKSNLGKKQGHKVLMLKTMTTQLIKHDTIETTTAKAKQMRYFAEKVVGLAKRGDLNARRQAAKIIKEKEVLDRLFTEFPQRYKFRKGGYTAIIKTRLRKGDSSRMSSIFYVDSPNHKLFVEAQRKKYLSRLDVQEEMGDFENPPVERKSDLDIEIKEEK